MSFEEIMHMVTLFLNLVSVAVLLIGVAKAIVRFLKTEVTLKYEDNRDEFEVRAINAIKRNLGSYVLLSLEVLIAADIIESIMNPTVNDIMILGAVVVIRTVISYFLGKEIEAESGGH